MLLLHRLTVTTLFIILMISAARGKVIDRPGSVVRIGGNVITPKQLTFLTGASKETTTPDFIRLVAMRFIYGLASSMGVEERLEGLFNGAFVPPNADGDIFGFGGLGGDSDDSVDYGGLGALEGLFDDDGL